MYITILLFLFIFIFTLLGMQLFGGKYSFLKEGETARQNFDSFIDAFLTVFQLMTMENWNEVLPMTLRSSVPKAVCYLYLIGWIFIGNYILLNLFTAVLLDGFGSSEITELSKEIDDENEEIESIYKKKAEQIEKERQISKKLIREQEQKLQDSLKPPKELTEADKKAE